jgi:hypothetical protein
MPNVIGSAMKFRKFSFMPHHALPPTIHTTAMINEAITHTKPRMLDVLRSTTIATARSDAPVASGPSRSIDRIISAKIVDRLAVWTIVPSGSRTLSVVFAMRSRL